MSVFPHRDRGSTRALEIEYRNVCIAYDRTLDRRRRGPSVRRPQPRCAARAQSRARRARGAFVGPADRSSRARSLALRAPDRTRSVPRRSRPAHGPRCAQPSGSCETRRARSEKRDVTFRYDSPQSTARGDATSDRRPGRRSRTRRLAREPERVSDRRRRLRLHISTRDVHSRLLDVSVGPGAESPYSRVTSSLGQSSRLTRSSRSPRTRRTPRRQGHLP